MKKSDKAVVIVMVSLVAVLIVVAVVSFGGALGDVSLGEFKLPEFPKFTEAKQNPAETVTLNDGEYAETYVYDDGAYDVTVYSKDGVRIRNSYYTKKDKLLFEQVYYENGTLKRITSYNEDGTLEGDYEYYLNGNDKKSTTYIESDGVVTVYVTEYDEGGAKLRDYSHTTDGTKRSESTYTDGELASRIYYDENGRLLMETTYTNGQEEHSCIYHYDENGEMTHDSSYYADGTKRGESTYADGEVTNRVYYDEKGRVTLEVYYKDGKEENYYICTYGEDGRLTDRTYYDAGGEWVRIETYIYDGENVSVVTRDRDGNIVEDRLLEGGKNNE